MLNDFQSLFGTAAADPSKKGTRPLVLEGTLTKICRKLPKPRRFLLYDDVLVYGVPSGDKLSGQRVLPLSNICVVSLPDDDELQNAFSIIGQDKSFIVMADTPEVKRRWIEVITKQVNEAMKNPEKSASKGGVQSADWAVLWTPDYTVKECQLCRSKFTTFNRRHHCRQCGKVVCGSCSDHQVSVSSSKKAIRICNACHEVDFRTRASISGAASTISRQGSVTKFSGFESDSENDDDDASRNNVLEEFGKYHRTRRVHGV